MDSNAETFFQSIETENITSLVKITNLENEIFRLSQDNTDLHNALEKQKKLHRKYAEDVIASEKIRMQDFEEEKRNLTIENKNLMKQNRQLIIDRSFYKEAFGELTKEADHDLASTSRFAERTASSPRQTVSPRPVRMVKSASTTSQSESISYCSPACTHRSSKVLSRVNKKLFEDNKKLKSKNNTLNTTIAMLKKKNKQLENFRTKIENKKSKFLEDSEQLEQLVASTKKKNKDTFNKEALARLRKYLK